MRIAIVNDLGMALESLRRIILSSPNHEIAWMAHDGREAVTKCAADPPEVILMDLIMPVMDGVEATRRIMRDSPCPILVVTATVGKNTPKVFEAMGHGALDAVNVPMIGDGEEARHSRDTLLRKIDIIGKLGSSFRREGMAMSRRAAPEKLPLIVAGASTGGPGALAKIVSGLPGDMGAAMVVIQHVDEKFSAELANWLNSQTALQVMLAREGAVLGTNTVYVAGTNDHLILTPELTFSHTPEFGDEVSHNLFRPSSDVFFKSVVRHWPDNSMRDPNMPVCVAILLTGMGRDGAAGLLELRHAGWHTIAQDQATSVVYGMPKAARDMGAATEILPVEKIAPAILRVLGIADQTTFPDRVRAGSSAVLRNLSDSHS
ncbi:MAG: hypothetical protein B6245_01230 [Desulfobacteraceae bacterium 4572_88]|nr:MAG: hypothetical protein B6245_01230 [Desulfobacteraceae bacterium 4572_88]